MANAGGLSPGGPVTLNFADTAGQVVPLNGPLTTGDVVRTSYGAVTDFPAPAPPGAYNLPGSTVGGLGPQMMGGNPNSTFGGTIPNGVWKLYVLERSSMLTPSTAVGNIAGGWGIDFIHPTEVGASISGRVTTSDAQGIRNAKVVVTGGPLTGPIIATTGSFGYFAFEGLATGQTYVVTVNSRRYTFGTQQAHFAVFWVGDPTMPGETTNPVVCLLPAERGLAPERLQREPPYTEVSLAEYHQWQHQGEPA